MGRALGMHLSLKIQTGHRGDGSVDDEKCFSLEAQPLVGKRE